MLLTTLSSWAYLEKRKLIEVFPEPVQKLWNTWELRAMGLISLALQISLIHFGSRRKYNVKNNIRVFLWLAYLMADWVATVALGVISQNQGRSSSCGIGAQNNNHSPVDDELSAFWAPFLLLHLGGPDTITAYALLGLVVQAGFALYIFLMAWKTSWLSFLTIPMLLAGLIKYGERTLALKSANRENFRNSMLTRPDPGPNYAKFMEEVALKKAEGYIVKAEDVVEVQIPGDRDSNDHSSNIDGANFTEENILTKANDLFKIFKRLFVGLILSFEDRDSSQIFFQNLGSSKSAFEVIEVELQYAYYVFYTKAPIICTRWGCVFRTITFCSTCLVFVFFLIHERHKHSSVDSIITYVLLSGAIILEIYALLLLMSSDWIALWLSKRGKTSFEPGIRHVQLPKRKRWSNSIAQFNLLSFCLKIKPATHHWMPKVVKNFSVNLKEFLFTHTLLHQFDEKLEMSLYLTSDQPVSQKLKELIFDHFVDNSRLMAGDLQQLCTGRGNLVLEKNEFPNFVDWTTDVEFDQSILLWHIATDLCYHSDDDEESLATDIFQHSDDDKSLAGEKLYRKVSKRISDYMMYLLIMCPFKLPIGIGLMRFQDTCAEAKEFFGERNLMISSKTEACKSLLGVETTVKPAKVKGDRSKSVLFDACILASSLNEQNEKEVGDVDSRVD